MARIRAWVVTALAVISLVLSVFTLVVPNWIERFFEAEPDAGSGAAEAGVALAFLAVTVVAAIGALLAWRSAGRGRSAGRSDRSWTA